MCETQPRFACGILLLDMHGCNGVETRACYSVLVDVNVSLTVRPKTKTGWTQIRPVDEGKDALLEPVVRRVESAKEKR